MLLASAVQVLRASGFSERAQERLAVLMLKDEVLAQGSTPKSETNSTTNTESRIDHMLNV